MVMYFEALFRFLVKIISMVGIDALMHLLFSEEFSTPTFIKNLQHICFPHLCCRNLSKLESARISASLIITDSPRCSFVDPEALFLFPYSPVLAM